MAVMKALLLAFILVALGLNALGNIGGVIALVAAAAVGIWLMWQNGKERAKAEKILSREYSNTAYARILKSGISWPFLREK